MNNSYITIIKEKRTALSRKRVPLNQNECTDDFRIGVPFEQNLQYGIRMCTIRHCVIVWVLMEIPEKMLTEFIILKRGLLKRNVYMKDGRQAVA